MILREGLSFSDYFDDSVPNDVKPVYSLTPMEETAVDFSKAPLIVQGWLYRDGKYFVVDSHFNWGMRYLKANNVPYTEDNVYELMYKQGFVRVHNNQSDRILIYEYRPLNPPSHVQLRRLREYCIENNYTLYNDVSKHKEDLLEVKHNNNDNRSIFIESMMPNDIDLFKSHLVQLFAHLQKELQLKTVPSLKLVSDEKNAEKVLGKTAYYNPEEKLVVLYITNRHQKDILRSFAHEIIHHWQHENEKLHEGNDKKSPTKDPQYAQNNPWLRQMEKQAYLLGNILFRDWEDQKKTEDKKSGNDGKTKKVKEQHGRNNVSVDSHTPIMKQMYKPSHPYRKYTEGPPEPDVEDVQKEQTYSLGNQYPPKKMNY